MEFNDSILYFKTFMSITIGITVLFIGKGLNGSVKFLRDFSIPNPVTGGFLFAIVSAAVFFIFHIEIAFELGARNVLLVYFFTTIGINASVKDLLVGGKPLIVLLLITVGFVFLQNLTGVAFATLFDLPAAVGLLGGSISMIGGHGTAIAWAPQISDGYGIASAMEIGLATATFGLILAGVIGGPVANLLIKRNKLEAKETKPHDVGVSAKEEHEEQISHLQILNAVLAIHICVILGSLLNKAIASAGFKLPLFVTCLLSGIILSNAVPKSFPGFRRNEWPSRSPAMTIIADVSLGTFLAMSLMSMKLWTLAGLAGPILSIIGAQFLMAVIAMWFVVFPAMGRNYDAAVISAGFGGFTLGSTPTAMANMAAVSQRHGASNLAFIIVPLICAFFIDLANALIIPLFLKIFA
jgi:ESS family glutamate:Na+ symporter